MTPRTAFSVMPHFPVQHFLQLHPMAGHKLSVIRMAAPARTFLLQIFLWSIKANLLS